MDAKSVIKYSVLIKNYLKSDIEDIFFNDGTIDIVGDVVLDTITLPLPTEQSLSGECFLSIPFGKITGSFSVVCDADVRYLNSFKNFPTEITKDLTVNGGNFHNFDNFPEKIGGSIYLKDNQIDSLKGMNIENVNGDFNCSLNNLKSLEGCPKHIEGDFNCSFNFLKDFSFAPEYVGGLMLCTNLIFNAKIDVERLNNITFGDQNSIINLHKYKEYLNFNKLDSSLQRRIITE